MALASVSFEFDFATDKNSKSRKAAYSALAHRIGALRPGISSLDIGNSFLARERLGSTAIGSGVAAPHTVLKEPCSPLVQVTHLKCDVDFDADDSAPVDLLLTVIGNRQYLRWLHLAVPRFTKLAQTPELVARLRSAQDVSVVEEVMAGVGIYSALTRPQKAA
jgi:PTS system nitrogen regulatory IIA component